MNIYLLIIFTIRILDNVVLRKDQQRAFLATTILTAFSTILEFITVVADGSPVQFKSVHILSNYFGFVFSPLIAYFLAIAIYPRKFLRFFIYGWLIYAGWAAGTLIFGWPGIFFIDEINNYHRDSFFFVYILFYITSIIILIVENIFFQFDFQIKGSFVLLFSFIFLIGGTSVQIIWPEMHVSCSCITLASFFYYIQFNGFMYQIDPETNLRTKKQFNEEVENINKKCVFLGVKIDNFNKIQKSCTRSKTDYYLYTIAKIFKQNFMRNGYCYRISQDEFCVLINNANLNVENKINRFYNQIILLSLKNPDVPLVSIGYTNLDKEQDLEPALEKIHNSQNEFKKKRLNFLFNQKIV